MIDAWPSSLRVELETKVSSLAWLYISPSPLRLPICLLGYPFICVSQPSLPSIRTFVSQFGLLCPHHLDLSPSKSFLFVQNWCTQRCLHKIYHAELQPVSFCSCQCVSNYRMFWSCYIFGWQIVALVFHGGNFTIYRQLGFAFFFWLGLTMSKSLAGMRNLTW